VKIKIVKSSPLAGQDALMPEMIGRIYEAEKDGWDNRLMRIHSPEFGGFISVNRNEIEIVKEEK
jgi:hypothetical protein